MRIKRLDITGFKSFMDRSVFAFGDGITGVVGPNGCGKSNVVDAIRWVMGEQSAKNLRGRGMEDVIFNGSESQSPLSMAEVSLTFHIDSADALSPQYAGFPEITVTRRLFRSGESEYLINKTACRLLDITELFLGTGVGTRAYSIIEQGRVGLIVSAKPEDRRSLIEEAAGVTKYKARRKAAERKMEYTQQNLLRVTDIASELGKRLDALDRQARKAEKYKKLKAEMRGIELHVASHKYLELLAEQKVLQARTENLSAEEREGLRKLSDLEGALTRRRTEVEDDGEQLSALAHTVLGLEGEVRFDEQSLAHQAQDQRSTRSRLEEAQGELNAVEVKRADLDREQAARERELEALGGNWKEDEVALGVAQEELRRATALQSELSETLESERGGLVSLASRLANHETNLTALSRARADLEDRRAQNRAQAQLVRQEEATLDQSRTQVAQRVSQTREAALELARRKGEEEDQLVQTRQSFAEHEVQVISSREELADKKSRLSSLEEIQRNYEGFDRGVRAVMLQAGNDPRRSGILGLVADLISAPPRYEKAIEAALGGRLQHVVVESQDRGIELALHLKSLAEGRSTFLPAGGQWANPVEAEALAYPGVLASAVSEVRCEEAIRPLVEALLGNVAIVANLEVAQGCVRSGARCTCVTLEGEVLGTDGSVTGGTLEGPAVGALQKKRQIAELAQEVERLQGQYGEVLTRHYTLQKQMGQTEGLLKGLAKNQHAEEVSLAAQERDLQQAGLDLAKIRDRVARLDEEEAQFSQRLSALASEEEASRGEVAHGQADQQSKEERVRQTIADLESLRGKSDQLSAQVTGLKVRAAANTERGEAARRELDQMSQARAELDQRLARLTQAISESEAHLEALSEKLDQTRAHREAASAQLGALSKALEARKSAHANQLGKVREDDAAVRDLRSRVDSISQGLSEISWKGRELELALQHLVQSVRERQQTELEQELHRFHLVALAPQAEVRLKELRAQVERMGEINLAAIEEHAELTERYQFLSKQKEDLEDSLERLKRAIQKIDRTSRQRFDQTFEVVNEKFQQVFPRLFGGGRAGLVLTSEGPNAEQGVEIVAQPPGKKLQSVTLLSGGEKALTAVSLIFAIFLIKPTPFCLLDEVDAPLDEANVGRYNEMVREMSRQSQFILITHNKRTMEVVDTLYGITMEEPGISKLVAVNLREAEAANEDRAA